MRQIVGSETTNSRHIFKDASIKRLIKARLSHKQALSNEVIERMNALLTQVFDSTVSELDNYSKFPFKFLKLQHFDAAAKKWLLAGNWEKEKQTLIGSLRAIEGAASVWKNSKED